MKELNRRALRIGNWVTIQNPLIEESGDFYEIGMFDCDTVVLDHLETGEIYGQEYDFIKPITLTEELFLKWGFKKNEIGRLCLGDSIYSFVDRRDLGFCLCVFGTELKETYLECAHELQNLWYDLTGIELKTKTKTTNSDSEELCF